MNFDVIGRRLEQALGPRGSPSAAVAIARDGDILWEQGFGWADRERHVPATAHTMYCIGSITKPITATALMILQERGLVDLTVPANEYLGAASLSARVGDVREATVLRLANHTAGLPAHHNYFYEDEPYRPPPMDETIRRYGNLVTAPGERYRYANLGYGILGHVIEHVSGKSYADFLRDEVFLPLGLRRCSVGPSPAFEQDTAREYGSDHVAYPRKVTDHPGAGAVYASVHDLVRFGMFHLKQRQPDQRAILTEASIDAMQTPAADSEGYGLGWGTMPDMLGYRIVGHAGGTAGATGQLLMFPTEGIVVAALTNTSRGDLYAPSEVVGDMVGVFLPEFGRQLAEQRSHRSDPSPAAQGAPAFSPPRDLIGQWDGGIHTPDGEIPFALWVSASGQAHARIAAQHDLVAELAMTGDRVAGTIPAVLPTEDAARRPHHVSLDLKVHGDLLNGAVLAVSTSPEEGGAPEKRIGFTLAYWAELHRA